VPGEIDRLFIDITDSGGSAAIASLNSLTASLQRLQAQLGTGAVSRYGTAVIGMGKDMTAGAKSADTASRSIVSSIMRIAAIYYVLKLIGRAFSKFIEESAGYVETLNMTRVTLGEYADDAIKNAEKIEQAYGLNSKDYLRFQSAFALLFTGFGNTSEQAYKMSESLTNLGYDLASLKDDLDFDTAMQALESGITGQMRSLKTYGLDVSNAALAETALKYGITEKVNAMNQAEKATLRYLTIMDHSDVIQGDLNRTINSTANQLRILKDQFNITARRIGDVFMPALNAVLPYLIAFLKVIATLASALAALFGFELPDFEYDGLDSTTESVDELDETLNNANNSANKLKGSLASFDELNVITQTKTGGGGGGGGSDWLSDLELPTYEFLQNVKAKAEEIKEIIMTAIAKIKEMFQPVFDGLVNIFNILKSQIDEITNFGQSIIDLFWAIVNFVRALSQFSIEALTPLIEAINLPAISYAGINLLKTAFNTLAIILDTIRPGVVNFIEKALVPIASWLKSIVLDGLRSLTTLFENIGTWVTDHKDEINSFLDSLATLVATLWRNLEPVLNAAWEVLKTIVTAIFDAIAKSIEDGTLTDFVDLLKKLVDIVSDLGVFDSAIDTITKFGDAITSLLSYNMTYASGLIDLLTGLVTLDYDKIKEGFGKIAEAWKGVFITVANLVIDALNRIIIGLNKLLGILGIREIPLIPNIVIEDASIDNSVNNIMDKIQASFNKAIEGKADSVVLNMTDWTTFETNPEDFGSAFLTYLSTVDKIFADKLKEMTDTYGDDYVKQLSDMVSNGALEAAKNKETIQAAVSLGEAVPKNSLDAFNKYQFGKALLGDIDAQMYIAGKEAAKSPGFMQLLSTVEGMGKTMDENFALGITANTELIYDPNTGALSAISDGIETNFPIINMALAENFADMGIDLRNYVSTLPADINTMLEQKFGEQTWHYTADGQLDVTIHTTIQEFVEWVHTQTTHGQSAVQSIMHTEDLVHPVPVTSTHPVATTRAGGGFVTSGDFFYANENGVPEYIGSFGNQTAVANTEQIVDGISSGVAEANRESNELLREQNMLLRALLEKENVIEPSPAWGRFNERSNELYAKAGG
jgi:hypothetical protein